MNFTKNIANILFKKDEDFWLNLSFHIPFFVFVFGAPIVFILIICFLQHRNRRLQQHQMECFRNQRFSM